MNPGSRDTPTEEKTQRLSSGDGHGHSKSASGSIVMHDHGRHSPASAHSPGVSGKLPGLHPDGGRTSRGFGTPSFPATGLPGFNLEHHLPFLFNSASSLIFPPFIHPSAGSLFPPVLPPNFLPPLQPPLSLFPSPNAECEVSSSGWSAHSGGSRNTSSLGSSSSEGEVVAKIDGRTVRSSRCSPDMNMQPTSLSSSVRKIWESPVVDPVCISDADMPLSLVTRRETTSRGSSVTESGVCTGDSVARAASSETSRTPSLDGESGCQPVCETSGVQEQTDQTTQWQAVAKPTTDSLQSAADDGKSSTSDDIRSSGGTAASRSSSIALPPRKRLTRNAEELQTTAAGQSTTEAGAANSPSSSAPNFRSCWKKFAAKSNVSVPSSHRAFGGKPQYDCRTYFQKLAEQARAAAASKAFVPGKGKGHCYRNANKTSPRSSDQNTGSPRVTRSQSKPKKTQSPKSSPSEPPAPLRKSTRKKSINTRFEEYDRTVGKNKKAKFQSSDLNAAASDAGKETLLAAGAGDEVTLSAEKNSQRKHRRRGKQVKGELSTDADISMDADDSTSSSQFFGDVQQPASEADGKLSLAVGSSVPAATREASDTNASTEEAVEPEPSVVITVLPPKFRHFKATKTAAATIDSSQPQTNSDRPVTTANESSISDAAASVKSDNTDSAAAVTQPEDVASEEGECRAKLGLSTLTENSIPTETTGGSLAEESKVSQSHSVGVRKSLLYRSSATLDSQSSSEAKTISHTECSVSIATDAVSSVSVDRTSANEMCEMNAAVLSEDASASECSKVLSELDEASLSSTALEAATADVNEKVQSDSDDVHAEPHVEPASVTASEVVSCTSPSVGIADGDLKTSAVPTTVSPVTDYPGGSASEETVQVTEHDSLAASVDSVTRRLGVCPSVPADIVDECDGHRKPEPNEGGDVSVISNSVSMESHNQSTDVDSTTASMLDEPVTAVAETSDLSCRTKPVDVSSRADEESVSQNGQSLKRPLPDDASANDDTKRRRVDSVDRSPDRLTVDTASQPVDITPDTDTAINSVSSAAEHDSQTCSVPSNIKSYTVTAARLRTSPSASIQNSSKPERPKRDRSKSGKTNRRLKPSRSRQQVVKTAADTEPPVLKKSDLADEAVPAESKAEKNREKYEPPQLEKLLDGSCETPDSFSTAIAKYTIANSIDKICDINSDLSAVQRNSEQKTLRISLVAVNESNSTHRVKNSRTEIVCNSNKLSSSSPAVVVSAATAASSGVNSLKQIASSCSLIDTEQPVPAGCIMPQDSALEHDSSSLLSQCKSLSVVLEKMHNNNNNTPSPASEAKPTGRRRKVGLAHRRTGPRAKQEVSVDESSIAAEKPAVEPLPSLSVDDEYSFPDDAPADSLPPQWVPRPERKVPGRKTRNLPAAVDQAAMSPAAASDSSSRGAASSVDSSVAGVRSLTPNAVQKVPSKAETGSSRSRRRRQNLQQEDEDTRSLSPFARNGSSPTPVPVVEASLDGHKLKLRIMKCTNRSVEASTCDAKVVLTPSSSVELPDHRTKLKDDEVPTPTDHEPPATVKVAAEQVSRRQRQLKVEGARSRFLTLHKPSGMVPSPDHVKCRLVKVGRRSWMSVGGEEPDDDSSTAQHSDTETPVMNSPAASSVDEMVQQPTRDRLLLVNERKKQRTGRRGRPPKVKTDSADANSSLELTGKRTKKKVKPDTSCFEISSAKPDPLPEVVSRPVRLDPVPWLDSEADRSETQPYCALGDNSSRTIATDIEEYRLHVSTPTELTSNIDLVISNALSDCGIEFAYSNVLTPRSMFFVPSELEQLMEELVLDDLRRQPRLHTQLTTVVPEARALSSASISGTFSYSDGFSSPILSPRNDREVDLLLSQSSLPLRNCMLPVDANDSSDHDCAVVYESPTRCYPDSVDLLSTLDPSFVDDDFSLSTSCLTDPLLYSCVDIVL